jgi:hypothetical protein
MRAYTSLAGHILGSHPRINGYFELHISYENASDLDRQLEVYQQYEMLKEDSRYLFDKLLHNDHRFHPEQLGLADIKILVSILEPERTLKSIVDLFAKKQKNELYASPLEATKYYIERVTALADFCSSTSEPYHYYDAQVLTVAPATLLSRLTDWLDLDSPLSERYQRFSQTGKFGKGDSSEFIHSGKIERAKTDYSHIPLPQEALSRAQEVYRGCRSKMMARAEHSVVMQEGKIVCC